MIKKLLAKLVNWTEQTEDFSKSAFRAGQKARERIEREHNDDMSSGHDPEYIPKRDIPSESEILGPSEGKIKD